jgi:hypothetical protein
MSEPKRLSCHFLAQCPSLHHYMRDSSTLEWDNRVVPSIINMPLSQSALRQETSPLSSLFISRNTARYSGSFLFGQCNQCLGFPSYYLKVHGLRKCSIRANSGHGLSLISVCAGFLTSARRMTFKSGKVKRLKKRSGILFRGFLVRRRSQFCQNSCLTLCNSSGHVIGSSHASLVNRP